MPDEQHCANCKWWAMNKPGLGICRRNPPVAFPVVNGEQIIIHTSWPTTKAEQFCGEWGIRMPMAEAQEGPPRARGLGEFFDG